MPRPYDDGRSPTRIASSDGRSPDKGSPISTLPDERLHERRPVFVDTDGQESGVPDSDDQRQADEEILALARRRFQTSYNAEAILRQEMVQDQRFYGGYQWPDQIKADRTNDKRPILTINRLPQFVKQITNPQRQSRPAIQINPVGDGADPDTAEVIQGIIRHIENTSHAEVAYDEAYEDAVISGRGWFRILTEYIDDGTFDQEIVVRRVPNPLSVYPDPASAELDYSDGRFLFVVEDIPKDEYKDLYGDASMASLDSFVGIGNRQQDWFPEGRIRIAEYFYVTHEERELCLIEMPPPDLPISTDGPPAGGAPMPPGTPPAPPPAPMGAGAPGGMPGAGGPPQGAPAPPPTPPPPPAEPIQLTVPKAFVPDGATILRTRTVQARVVNWVKMNAAEILERRTWPGSWIPVVPILGDEIMIDGQKTLVGIVRFARDPQRMYNYWVTHLTEMIALAPRVPFVGAEGQFKGHEPEWKLANIKNLPYLEYVPVSLDGKPVPAPARQQFEPPIQAASVATKQADNDLKSVIGLYDASLGERGPDQSGKAILARQKQGETANVNFIDNFGRALWHAARIYLDLIPKVFDTERVIHIMGADDQRSEVTINATFVEYGLQKIFDVRVGRYNVTMSVGPSYQGRRQEAVASMLQLVQGAPDLIPIIGDLMVGEMDWPVARQIAERLKKMLPPQLQDDDQSELPPQAQAIIGQLKAQMAQMAQQLQQAGIVIQTKQVETQGKTQIAQMQIAAKHDDAAKDREVKLAVAELGAKMDRLKLFLEESHLVGDRAHEAASSAADSAMERQQTQQDHQNTLDQQQASTAGSMAEADQAHGHTLVQQQASTLGDMAKATQGHAHTLEQGKQAAALAPKPKPPTKKKAA